MKRMGGSRPFDVERNMSYTNLAAMASSTAWCTSSMSALAACYPHMRFNYVPNKWPALTEATRCLKRYENRSIMVTTGLMSIFHLLSTQTCPTMRLYGFDDESASSTSTYHYYDAGYLSDGRGALFDKYSKSRKHVIITGCLAADPLAKMELAPADFGASVRMIADEFGFPRERIALGLEGGYDLGDAGMPAAVVETAAALVER